MKPTMAERARSWPFMATIKIIGLLRLPATQMLVFAALAIAAAEHGLWTTMAVVMLVIVCAVATLPAQISGARDGAEMSLNTNATAVATGVVQTAMLWALWTNHRYGEPGFLGILTIAMGIVVIWDASVRFSFVMRVRRAGGIDLAAHAFAVNALSSDNPHDAITRENVRKRDYSQLHWRYGEALTRENVALYKQEKRAS